MIFLSNFRIETFLKNTPFSGLKNLHAENERDELGKLGEELSRVLY
jgi:energy-converting hydrogenase A subunit M